MPANPPIVTALNNAYAKEGWETTGSPNLDWRFSSDALFNVTHEFLRSWDVLEFDTAHHPERRLFSSDQTYFPVPLSIVASLMRATPLPPPTLSGDPPELADCDDYALSLKVALAHWFRDYKRARNVDLPPPAIGTVFTQNHALCLILTRHTSGKLVAGVCDPSHPDFPIRFTIDPQTLALFQTPPIRLILF